MDVRHFGHIEYLTILLTGNCLSIDTNGHDYLHDDFAAHHTLNSQTQWPVDGPPDCINACAPLHPKRFKVIYIS